MHDFPPYWLSSKELALFEECKTTAYRVYSDGDLERDYGNVRWIERYGEDYLIAQTHAAPHEALTDELKKWTAAHKLSLSRIFLQIVDPKLPLREAPCLIFAAKEVDLQNEPTTIATEFGLRYLIDWRGVTGRGLYIDQRENRAFLAKLAPARLLNLFAYTCSFSVVAAKNGAITTNIDLSKPSLERGKENFKLNDIDPDQHFFHASDVRDSLELFAKKKIAFDAILLDPPTFSKNKAGVSFQVERDFFAVLKQALACAEKNASILLSTNCRTLTEPILRKQTQALLTQMELKGEFFKTPDPVDIPTCHLPTTLWLRLKNGACY